MCAEYRQIPASQRMRLISCEFFGQFSHDWLFHSQRIKFQPHEWHVSVHFGSFLIAIQLNQTLVLNQVSLD
jgi:hypothetical protein